MPDKMSLFMVIVSSWNSLTIVTTYPFNMLQISSLHFCWVLTSLIEFGETENLTETSKVKTEKTRCTVFRLLIN